MKGESVCSVLVLLAGLQVVLAEPVQQLFSFHSDQSIFSNLTAPYLSFLDYLYYHLGENVSEQCKSDTNQLIHLARQGDTNALKILDSNGKPSSGILEGGVFFIGFYSECVDTSFKGVQNTVDGKYCLINLNFSAGHKEILPHASWLVLTQNSKPPTIAVCVPASCSKSDVQFASNASAHENFDDIGAAVSVCHGDVEGFSTDVGAFITLIIFLIFVSLAIAATICDFALQRRANRLLAITEATAMRENNKNQSTQVLCVKEANESERKPSVAMRCLLAFSLKTNAERILTVRQGGDNIGAVHGIKVLGMALITLAHSYSFATQNLFIRNPLSAQAAPKNFVSQVFANGTFIVDTFYVISGILVTFGTFKVMKKTGGKLPVLYFYVHRYFRLTPLLVAVVLYCAFLLRYMNSGPNWLASIEMYDVWCKENGWLNALYLHNFINTEHMCLSHSWYLATDMQMYLVTPLILIPLYKNFKYGAVSLSIFLFATTLATALITFINHYPAVPYINNLVPLAIVNDYYKNVYIKTYCRMGPYLIGILVGYFLVENKELVLKKRTVAIIWTLSVGLGFTVIYLMWPANMGHLPSDSEAAAYSALARTVWGACIGWLIMACYYGYGGFINSILSCSMFVPLSRLTYGLYLIHPVVMNVYYGSTQTIIDFSMGFIMYTFLGNLVISFVLAFFLSLLFESPVIGLERVLLFR